MRHHDLRDATPDGLGDECAGLVDGDVTGRKDGVGRCNSRASRARATVPNAWLLITMPAISRAARRPRQIEVVTSSGDDVRSGVNVHVDGTLNGREGGWGVVGWRLTRHDASAVGGH
jgi:hypothetical protein